MNVEDYALAIWQNGSNDDVWNACFEWADDVPELTHSIPEAYGYESPRLIDVAAELLGRIVASPDFTVGDLTHEQVIATILKRYPILGPLGTI